MIGFFALLFSDGSACLQVRQGAHAIFGPSDPQLGAHVQSICDALEIPHLEVLQLNDPHLKGFFMTINDDAHLNDDFPPRVSTQARLDMDSEYKPYSINVYPPIDIINKAFLDVMFFLNWTKVAIIYEEDQGWQSFRVLKIE